jgi:hypothetical protein
MKAKLETMTTARFAYRGQTYVVSGHIWASDGAANGMYIEREDGQKIRGVKMLPGMVETGHSRTLERLATLALEAARERESDDVSGPVQE